MSVASLLLALGCHSPRHAETPSAASAVATEPSVRPGINKEFEHPDVEKWTGIFESESRETFHERERIVATVGVRPGMAIADIGAGTGFFTELFARQVGRRGKVYAVEIAPEFLAHIRSRAEQTGLRNVRTVLCTADSAKLPPASIDIAFICDTYHHFEFPRSTMRSIHRALKPRGQLVVIDFKRIPGESRQWVLEHVRAGQEEVTAELRADGFEPLSADSEAPYLTENYLLRFRKAG